MSQPKDLHSTTVQQAGLGPVSSETLPKNRSVFTVLAGPEPGRIFSLENGEVIFGRDDTAAGRLLDDGLSRRHARAFRKDGVTFVEDLGSTNGTFVGDERLSAPKALKDGDRVGLGRNVVLKFALLDVLEEEAQRTLYESTVRDPLTRAHNRRYLEERLASELAYAERHGADLTLAMIDIDHFKRINDGFGHPAGDFVLKKVSSAISRSLRVEDVFARFGGEEFVVLLRGITPEKARQFGERARALLESLVIEWEAKRIPVTASLGIATMTAARRFPNGAELLAAADAALYAAKNGGRNRVEIG
ncbi:MAG: diguanylate cyclase [Myxococcales bacterium]|nr:diguanylate cyclase [Myxococcales bacterium]